jgi:uncharacterized protein YijF (DUF1287 family)
VKKPAKARQKSAGSAKQTRASARAPRARSPRPRVNQPAAATSVAHPTPSPRAAPTTSASPPSRDDRRSLVLLALPVIILTFALGAVQSLAPNDSARRQLALLPPASTVTAATPSLAVSATERVAAEKTLAPLRVKPSVVASVAASPVATLAVHDNAPVIPTGTQLAELPPADGIVARIASLGHPDRCLAAAPAGKLVSAVAPAAPSPEAFGRMLAAAARHETEDLIVYTDKYRDMRFPMGDVPALYGVCTDVVVRAYRALGIDLQVLVHNAKLGTGDTSIDHRRVETLRRFFTKYGTSIPVSDFVEEFLPGDIVTYRRPEGRGSQTHIGIVSDVVAPSGRPMIVHNRGWGPQLEDALLANPMTGHYRFMSAGPAELTVSRPPPATAHHAAQTPWPEAQRLRVDTADAH